METSRKTPDITRYEDPWTAEVYDCEVARSWRDRDLEFYLGLAAEAQGPILELACGTGRVALPLARAGAAVTGLDISPHMLAVAGRKLEREEAATRERVSFVQGDMSDFDLGRQFALAVIPFRAFQALLTRDEQRGCLQSCRRHLLPEGRLAINVFNPRLSRLAAQCEIVGESREFAIPGGASVCWSAVTRFDTATQTLHSRQRYHGAAGCREIEVQDQLLRLHYFHRFEIEWMLEACGFEVEMLYGNLDRSEFTADSPEMIFVARRV